MSYKTNDSRRQTVHINADKSIDTALKKRRERKEQLPLSLPLTDDSSSQSIGHLCWNKDPNNLRIHSFRHATDETWLVLHRVHALFFLHQVPWLKEGGEENTEDVFCLQLGEASALATWNTIALETYGTFTQNSSHQRHARWGLA